MAIVKLKRAYEPPEKVDGFRILVDRLWSRGIRKEEAHFDVWLKEIAPSAGLRKWFNHEVKKWEEFYEKYWDELKQSPYVDELRNYLREQQMVTLVYGAKDPFHNHAVVLKDFLEKT